MVAKMPSASADGILYAKIRITVTSVNPQVAAQNREPRRPRFFDKRFAVESLFRRDDLFQYGLCTRMTGSEHRTAVLVGENRRVKCADLPRGPDNVLFIHADERTEHWTVCADPA